MEEKHNMKKLNVKKFKNSNKGITLIALVITIIVLLILAGITIAMLTGSENAPAKANEAKQLNDIGSAKDQLAILVQNEQLEAYDDVYVDNNGTVKATAATTTIGQRVINAALGQYGTAKQIGDATMQVTQSAEGQDAIVTITTRDITEKGYIEANGGKLNWGEKPVKIINFTFKVPKEGVNYNLQAEEGMTWQEWLESNYYTALEDEGFYMAIAPEWSSIKNERYYLDKADFFSGIIAGYSWASVIEANEVYEFTVYESWPV
jgi:cytoskeletal protein RodZ